ncbi:MAG: TrkA family potassium uptake protein [Clostridia bacterium]|nr:TrkA family potassium uptake protein [Clostridia bacterium]MDE7329466.1 TrkA family potassium uptake protein [Clostridia bacterium]
MRKFKHYKKQQFAILGLGRFGMEITKALYNYGYEVLAVDVDEEKINEVSSFCTHSIVADVSEESTLKSLSIESFDTVIIAIGNNIQASIITALTCIEMGVKNIIAKAHNDKHGKLLSKIGVTNVIYPEAAMAVKVATMLVNPNIQNHMEIVSGYSIAEINISDKWINKNLGELALRNQYAVNVLIIIRADDELITTPSGDTILKEDDILVVGGSNEDIESLSFAVRTHG